MRPLLAGTLLPLFDCFCSPEAAAPDGRPLDAAGVHHSLQRDLVRLCNVRNALTIDQFLDGAPTSLDYGMPDTLVLSPQSAKDLQRLELVIARAVALYEPRLSQVRVRAAAAGKNPAAARIGLSGVAAQGAHRYQVQFELVLDGRAARPDAGQ